MLLLIFLKILTRYGNVDRYKIPNELETKLIDAIYFSLGTILLTLFSALYR